MRARSLSTRIVAGSLATVLVVGAGFGVAASGSSARSTQYARGATPNPTPGQVGSAYPGGPYGATTSPYGTTTPHPTTTVAAPGSTTAVKRPEVAITTSQRGSTVTVAIVLPTAVQSLTFRWANGVSFGQTRSKKYITGEIALRSSANRAIPFTVTSLSKPHGQVIFAPRSHTVTALRFALHVKYLYLTAAERRTLRAHHTKVVSGTLTVRLRNGKRYTKAIRYTT